jgi:hypothetical protein
MLTVMIVGALLLGAVLAGELVRGQCRRMLSRPHPSVLAAVRVASGAETVPATERALGA